MIELEVIQADVTTLELDAIANAANTELRHGGGVAAAMELGGPTSADIISRATTSTVRKADVLHKVVFAVHGDAAEQAFLAAVRD